MEKARPHCKLERVRALVVQGKVLATATAYRGAREIGIHDMAGMCEVILALVPAQFHKSMTTHAVTESGRTSTTRGPRGGTPCT